MGHSTYFFSSWTLASRFKKEETDFPLLQFQVISRQMIIGSKTLSSFISDQKNTKKQQKYLGDY